VAEPAALPLRRTTLLAGVRGIASLARLPFFGLLLRALAAGVRLLAGSAPGRLRLARSTA
jgi:hypothetical protein